ncbi:MAG TPA: hypothetical protein DCP02_04015 [Actinobacteria bacterium]|nr:hypothetical protein [Actinomycetota bacterium]
MRKNNLNIYILAMVIILFISSSFIFSGCRNYDGKFDVVYFFKTEPEKAVIDFLESLDQKDAEYIYNNLVLSGDKNRISREKYLEEFSKILEDIVSVAVRKTVYLGYEDEMSKVVAEFDVIYHNGEIKNYTKYFYLVEENNSWKIILEKTFI